ncbi:MAG: hypothetical protein QM820_08530 [Minicystis sp.]
MEQDPTTADYLDAIFASIRTFAQEMETSKRWLLRAERTASPSWRLTFLREARAALERAPQRLAAVSERLAALGPPEALPPPLDRVHGNLATMRTDSRDAERAAARGRGQRAADRPGVIGRAPTSRRQPPKSPRSPAITLPSTPPPAGGVTVTST